MKLSDTDRIELHDLFDGLVENNLSIRQKEQLQSYLEDSEEARDIVHPVYGYVFEYKILRGRISRIRSR